MTLSATRPDAEGLRIKGRSTKGSYLMDEYDAIAIGAFVLQLLLVSAMLLS